MASRSASSAPFPVLANAEFARLGGLHRNTFLNSPKLLDATLRLKAEPRLRFAGQITGCEGYVESAAIGLLAGRFAAAERLGEHAGAAAADHRARRAARRTSPAAIIETIDAGPRSFQPMNINFGLFPPLARQRRRRMPTASGCAAPAKTARQETGAVPAAPSPISTAGSAGRDEAAADVDAHSMLVMPPTDISTARDRHALAQHVVLKRDVFSTVERGCFRDRRRRGRSRTAPDRPGAVVEQRHRAACCSRASASRCASPASSALPPPSLWRPARAGARLDRRRRLARRKAIR